MKNLKTPEDEAFDELAQRQGMWGGGFHAKRAAAADKLQDGKCKLCVDGCAACDARAQPAQEPVGEIVVESMGVRGSDAMQVRIHFYEEIPPVGSKVYTTPPKRERVLFPTMLRKMWSGGEVQAWLDENVNKEKNT
jgi:hypothetical protein